MRDKWWHHELERRERAWQLERASLIETICHLAGKPLPQTAGDTVEPDDYEQRYVFSPSQLPDDD